MIARAPGKLFATGAYAVLSGAPAVVLAVDRYVEATARSKEDDGSSAVRLEVAAVAKLLSAEAPTIVTTSLERGGRKLGLGSSAASAVAATGLILASRGEDLRDAAVVARVIELARRAHREVQPRGSGGDIAACALGGAVMVRLEDDSVAAQRFPMRGIVFRAFALDRALRTSDALDRLSASAAMRETQIAIERLSEAAEGGARAFLAGDADGVISAATAHVDGLRALARALDLPLVPPEVEQACNVLGTSAMTGQRADFALLPSGAGGGDTVLWLSARMPTEAETAALHRCGLTPLDLGLDSRGVHLAPTSAPSSL